MQTRRAAWRRLPTRLPRRPAPANPAFPLSPGRQDRALELGSRLWGYLKHGPPRTQRQRGLPGQQPRGAWQIASLAVAVPKDAPLLPRTLSARSAQGRGVSPSQPARQPVPLSWGTPAPQDEAIPPPACKPVPAPAAPASCPPAGQAEASPGCSARTSHPPASSAPGSGAGSR